MILKESMARGIGEGFGFKAEIRNTNTEYGIRNWFQTWNTEYEYGIRNTDLVSKLEYRIRNTDCKTLPKAGPHNTEYEYGIRNTDLASKLKYRIRIRNTEYGLSFKAGIQNTNTNTNTEFRIRSVFQS